MNLDGKISIITGAGGGIGGAMAAAFVEAGSQVVLADQDSHAIDELSAQLNERTAGSAVAIAGDVSRTDHIVELVAGAEDAFGPVDVYCANAGLGGGVGLDATDDEWDRFHQVNVMAHVRAAKVLVPQWVERGRGYFVSTASAAGLLTQIGSATYSVTKHGAVAFAEWLSVTYGNQGVAVSCLCPMGVNTDMLAGGSESTDAVRRNSARSVTAAGQVLEPHDVADKVVEAMAQETFLILPHPDVAEFVRRRADDRDRWLAGMRRYQDSLS